MSSEPASTATCNDSTPTGRRGKLGGRAARSRTAMADVTNPSECMHAHQHRAARRITPRTAATSIQHRVRPTRHRRAHPHRQASAGTRHVATLRGCRIYLYWIQERRLRRRGAPCGSAVLALPRRAEPATLRAALAGRARSRPVRLGGVPDRCATAAGAIEDEKQTARRGAGQQDGGTEQRCGPRVSCMPSRRPPQGLPHRVKGQARGVLRLAVGAP